MSGSGGRAAVPGRRDHRRQLFGGAGGVEGQHRPLQLVAEPGLLPLGILSGADRRRRRPRSRGFACPAGTRLPRACRWRRAPARRARHPRPARLPPPRSALAAPFPRARASIRWCSTGRGRVRSDVPGCHGPDPPGVALPEAERPAGQERHLDRRAWRADGPRRRIPDRGATPSGPVRRRRDRRSTLRVSRRCAGSSGGSANSPSARARM